jgi:hypothetical protein
MDLREIVWELLDRIDLSHDRDKWWICVKSRVISCFIQCSKKKKIDQLNENKHFKRNSLS